MKRILIIDDDGICRDILKTIFSDEFEIEEVGDGEEAVALLKEHIWDYSLIFLDLIMPKLDGIEVLSHIREIDPNNRIPVIMITGEATSRTDELTYELGAADIIYKPISRGVVNRRAHNIIELYESRMHVEKELHAKSRELYDALDNLSDAHEMLRRNNEFLVNALSSVVEFRSLESGLHISRVKKFTYILLNKWADLHPEYEFTEEDIEQMVNASALHDIGKIAIRDDILLKPGRFTPEEFAIMKTHTTKGCELLERFKQEDSDFYRYCYDICRYHHERFDGRGYPDGLIGNDIPIWAQIVSVVDVFDALVSPRVYKDPYPIDEAFRMIWAGECGEFNPDILECLKEARDQIIYATNIMQDDTPEKKNVEAVMKVLVVDDNDFSAELLKSMIERKDVEFLRAKDGVDAERLFQESEIGDIGVILMDIVMENESGNIAADRIRALDREDAKTVKIYATTAYRGFDFKTEGRSFNGSVFKPFKKEVINELINNV